MSRSGQPVDGCFVDTTCTSEPKVAVAEIGVLSGPDGAFGRGLLPATYVFTAYRTESGAAQVTGASRETRINAGEEAEVLIVLEE